jgi:NYN domain
VVTKMSEPQSVVYFWDMQNCNIPAKASCHEVCSKIREVIEVETKTREVCQVLTKIGFNAYVDVQTLYSNQRLELARARVTLRDVPSHKPGAADIRLLQDILNHTMLTRTGIVVIISA